MKKTFGYILVAPSFICFAAMFVFPIYMGFTTHEWTPAIVIFSAIAVMIATNIGFKLLDKE